MRKSEISWMVMGALLLVDVSGKTAAVGQSATSVRSAAEATAVSSLAVTLPAGTKVPLTLVTAIKRKSSKVGDLVRGQVAFPVTVGNVVAIPAGSYVEGVIAKLDLKRTRKQPLPDVEIHFTRLLYANGYSVLLDANSLEAKLERQEGAPAYPEGDSKEGGDLDLGFLGQQTPQPAPLPQLGPSPAVIGGIVGGVGAAVLAGVLIGAHYHGASQDAIVLDAGWQFQMVTVGDVVLDGAKVRAAEQLALLGQS